MVQHIFQPIRAVRNLHRDPVGLAGLHSSVPVQVKSEQVAVEVIFGIAVVNQKSSVNHVARNRRESGGVAGASALLRSTNSMRCAFRVVHDEARAVVGMVLELRTHSRPSRSDTARSAATLSVAKAT